MSETRMQMGKYELLEELGRGGFATVYKARDPSLDRAIALKVLHAGYAGRSDVVPRFLDEARRAASLRHDGIVRIYDVGEVKGQPYIAMEYLPGGALSDRLKGEPLPFDAALTILEQIADALDYAHKRDLVHRDVKPANILFDDEGRAVLVDFGLVKSLVESGYTVESTSLGTPDYMAPEQAQAGAPVDARTDVYALGVVAYELLTGRVPFEADTPLAVLRAHLDVTPPDPRQVNDQLDGNVAAILLKALAKAPTERYASASGLARALREAWQAAQHVSRTKATLADLYAQTQEAMKAGRWGTVVNLCVEMRNLDPDYRDVGTLLTLAASRLAEEEQVRQQERELGERYDAAIEALDTGRYAEAVEGLEQIAGQAANFRDVQARLAEARDERQRAQRYDEAVDHGKAERWAEACRVLLNVLRGRPDYRGGEAVLRLLDAVDGLLAQREAVWLARSPGVLEGRPPPGQDRIIWGRDGKEMVRVAGGTFLYGDDKSSLSVDEFWIDKTPVTNAEYARFVTATHRTPPVHWKGEVPPHEIADHPVTYVDWNDAVAYAEWAGKRLPAEQEWEKAARGTDGRRYPWGDDRPTKELCNFNQNVGGTTPVGKYSPQGDSPYGCVDMAGNVWEWTVSDYDKKHKMLRGGSWGDLHGYGEGYVRAASHSFHTPVIRLGALGFRCVSAAPGQ